MISIHMYSIRIIFSLLTFNQSDWIYLRIKELQDSAKKILKIFHESTKYIR